MRTVACALIVTAFLIGCTGGLLPEDPIPPDQVEVTIPPLPSEYGGVQVDWVVRWWDGARVRSREVRGASPARSVAIVLPVAKTGAELVVIEAVPTVASVGVDLRAYGGWIAPPVRRTDLVLKRGVLAGTLISLARDRFDPALVNVERIQLAIDDEYRLGERVIDRMRLEEGLREVAFRYYHVRGADEGTVVVRRIASHGATDDPFPWGWYTDDQSAPRSEAVVAGEYLLWAFPVVPGSTRSFWRTIPSGTVQKMTLSLTTEGHGTYHIFDISR